MSAKFSGFNSKGPYLSLEKENVFSCLKECTLLQCFAYGCVGICRVSYFDSVRDYLLSGI